MSKYANKNTIALGLGCVGSGALVLFLELSLRMGTSPSVEDEYILYFACAGGPSTCLTHGAPMRSSCHMQQQTLMMRKLID